MFKRPSKQPRRSGLRRGGQLPGGGARLGSTTRRPGPFARLAAAAAVVALVLGGLSGAGSVTRGRHLPARTTLASSGGQVAYWLGAADGGVYGEGTANLGQVRPAPLNKPVVGMAATPDGGGYWLVASDGGIFSYGDAAFYGSTGGMRLNQPVVGMAPTPTGHGYWLVASDGGIFSFGDARFYGSTGSLRLNQPVVGMAATPDGGGYWLVASDGGIFSFGDARFYGSTGGFRLNQPVVGMASTGTGGYWLVARDGGIFSFGDARFYGSTGGMTLNEPIVGMAATPDGGGYWLVASDGGIFTFGDAPYRGSTGGNPGPAPIIGIAATARGAVYPPGTVGTDYSWPNCSSGYPAPNNPVSVVGVNGGMSNDFNPCFASEADNAGANLTVYINTDEDQPSQPQALSGPRGNCSQSDLVCTGYNWGFNNAKASINWVHAQGFDPQLWWLDVEAPCGSTYPLWMCGSAGQQSNAAVIQGAIDAVHTSGLEAGIYSTYVQWPEITGGSPGNDAVNYPGMPIWIATVPSSTSQWQADCYPSGGLYFAEGSAWLVQWLGDYGSPTAPYDGDLACQT